LSNSNKRTSLEKQVSRSSSSTRASTAPSPLPTCADLPRRSGRRRPAEPGARTCRRACTTSGPGRRCASGGFGGFGCSEERALCEPAPKRSPRHQNARFENDPMNVRGRSLHGCSRISKSTYYVSEDAYMWYSWFCLSFLIFPACPLTSMPCPDAS